MRQVAYVNASNYVRFARFFYFNFSLPCVTFLPFFIVVLVFSALFLWLHWNKAPPRNCLPFIRVTDLFSRSNFPSLLPFLVSFFCFRYCGVAVILRCNVATYSFFTVQKGLKSITAQEYTPLFVLNYCAAQLCVNSTNFYVEKKIENASKDAV